MTRIPSTLARYEIPQRVVETTQHFLRESGQHGFEAVVLWVGVVLSDTSAAVVLPVRPGQTAYRGEQGCAVEIPPDALSELISSLPDNMVVLARLHTHPGDAYHSPVDDNNMLIAHEGAISIVVPKFAAAPIELISCSVNELRSARGWRELTPDEVQARFVIT